MKYAWIYEHKMSFSVQRMCKVIKVNRSAYYHWASAGCVVKKVDIQLNELIKSIFIFGRNN